VNFISELIVKSVKFEVNTIVLFWAALEADLQFIMSLLTSSVSPSIIIFSLDKEPLRQPLFWSTEGWPGVPIERPAMVHAKGTVIPG
jgi:hypothetical protein